MMKLTTFLTFTTLFTFIACNTSENEPDENSKSETVESLDSTTQTANVNPHLLSVAKWDSLSFEGDYFIINFKGVSTETEAIEVVDSLLPTFPDAGYLWIPDFASLSGKELFVVFLDQSKYKFSILETLQNNKIEHPGIYAVNVNQTTDRWVAYSPIDIRINGEKQKMILTYATPEDSEEYANEGGEDWGWFVNDVGEYFRQNHPEVQMESVFYSGLLPAEIEALEDELDLEGFCYIFTDGKNKMVVGHDMPDFVISEACIFFGFEEPDFGY
ncbi:MAG: hypothetical protein H6600_04525 [Flavobacteriales bacterium]|nr:hypothetical protein [Flavobacteriales bacterium]MCB9197701.1 hypothetical protein [Flavobacteriales bacterium]